MNKIVKSRLYLIAEPKKTLYLQRNENSNGFTGTCKYLHSGHASVACHSEALQCGIIVRSSVAIPFLVGLLSIVLSILPQDVAAQDGVEGYKSLIPQAPDAQALARAIDIPVNAYTGIPQISIPLYEINLGELTIPITLSYHAGGILANQEATEVGLGWSLSAGGSITRTIKCLDDFEIVRGYFSYPQDWNGDSLTLRNYYDIGNKTYIKDMEPDIFYYSTPTESGKFFFDHERTPHFVNRSSNLQLAYSAFFNRLEIVDSKGIKYQYEDTESTRTFTKKGMCKVNTTPGGYDENFNGASVQDYQVSDTLTSSWNLSRIITQTGDSVRFIYEVEKYQLPIQETASWSGFYSSDGPIEAISQATLLALVGPRYSSQKCLVNGMRLIRIQWRGGEVFFESGDREDIKSYTSGSKPKKVTAVRVTDNTGKTVRYWRLDYGYFNANAHGELSHLYKRLKLLSVRDSLANNMNYRFNYYETLPLPAKNTRNTDYWGYFNGSEQDSSYFCPAVVKDSLWNGGDKTANPRFSKAGILESMTNPLGGTTSFTYENNTVSKGEYSELRLACCDLDASRSAYEGLCPDTICTINLQFKQKVKIQISASNQDDINTQTGYTFIGSTDKPFQLFQLSDTGASTCILSYEMPTTWDDDDVFQRDTTLMLGPGSYVMRVECIVDGFVANMRMQYTEEKYYQDGEERVVGGLRISHIDGEKSISYEYGAGVLYKKPAPFGFESVAYYPLPDTCGYVMMFVQYSESVTSLSTIASGQTMGYSAVREVFDDGSSNRYQYHNEEEPYQVEGYPMAGTHTDWMNGSLLIKESFDSSNQPCETSSYSYSDNRCDSIVGFVYDGNRMLKYRNLVCCPLPISTHTTTYLSNGSRTSLLQRTYDNQHYQCTSEIVKIGYDSLVTRYFYPYDLTDSVSQQMVAANIIGSPVAQLKSRNGTIFDGAWTRYEKFDGRILPSQELRLNTDQTSTNLTSCRFDTIMEYRDYDRYGNPRWMIYKGTPVTCLWGYHGMHPVIEIVGADFSNVQSQLSSSTVSSLLDTNGINSTQLRGWHNALQGAFHDFSVSACRYVPLVGPSEIIGPDGISTTFEYDAAGRLTSKWLHGTELLQHYSYHYGLENYRTTASMLDSNASDSLLTVQYYDQWGRPSLLASQDKSADRNFSYSLQSYDFLGRPFRAWNHLPTSDSSPHSMTESAFATASASYYSDTLAFSENSYDALGNIVRVTIPGEAWKEEGRQNTYRYLTNESNEVKRYSITSSGGLGGGSTYYPTGTLLCTEHRDPDGKKVKKYSDIFGNVILERRTDSLETFDTYYVHDALNRLRMVLSPKCQESADNMVSCRYEYRYDGKGQVTWKRLPGCEPVQYWYNKQGLPVCMQDGMLRSDSRYRFFVYDRLGRLCIQGITPLCYHQTHFSFISQTFSGPLFKDTDYRYLGDLSELSPEDCTLELVNYYDRYNYLSASQPVSGVAQYASSLSSGSGRARLTGSRQYASNGEAMLATFAYDDRGRVHKTGAFGLNGILTVTDYHHNFFDGIDSTRTTLLACTPGSPAWTGSILESYTYYPNTILPHAATLTITNGRGSTSSETIRSLSYDDFGNVIGNDRGGTVTDMTYTYDLLHGWIKEISSSGGFEQKLYREDNSGNELYNGSISTMTWKVPGQNYLRRYDYTYDELNRLTEGRYSQLPIMTPVLLQGTGEGLSGLGMEEEAMPLGLIPVIERPGEPDFPNLNATDRYTERISYDRNSNITSIERYGMNNQRQYGQIDSLVITHNGNQLKTIEDHAEKHLTYTGASDFYDGCTYSNEYYYNANGALESDINRDIDLIQYDALGNTRFINYFEHDQIEYIYAADGTKLRTIHRPASSTALTDSIDYVGNLILKNGQPSMYLFDGGYASFGTNGAVDGWHYYIQDYMGNNRMVVNKNGTVEQVTHYYPYGGVIGDISTNENVQKYKFEGKELDRTFGLDNYDIHARQYFAMAPMWDRIDPLTEDNPQFSPYSYCFGNPVNYGDYDGFIPSVYAAALMSALAYGEDNNDNYKEYQKDLNRQDWYTSTLIDNSVLSDFWTGLECVLFEHRLGNGEVDEYVLAFAGTDPLSAIDWVNDIEQIYGNSPQYDLAISIAKDVNIIVEGFELTYVGHSLGGGETTAASMATGNHGITFNSAAVSDETLERNGIDPSMPANVDNYVASGIRIPFTNTRIGGDIVNNLQGKAGLHLRGNIHEVYTGPIPTHTKDTMIKALHQKDLRQVF